MRRLHQLHTDSARRGPLPVAVIGLGPIGLEVARVVLDRPELFRLVGAVDRAPDLAGAPLARVLGRAGLRGRIQASIDDLPRTTGVAFHTIASHLPDVVASVEALLARGWHVVSSSEELSYPNLRRPDLARRIDRAARRAQRVVVGTGINPGFAMDVWPLVLTSNCQTLDSVVVERVVDARQRRVPLQRKIGSGMTRAAFEGLARRGQIGHVGLVESVAHLGGCLGFALDTVRETLVPAIAKRRIRTTAFDVAAGRVCGIHHRAEGHEGRKRRIVLDLRMALDADEPRDEIWIEGTPSLHCIVPGGFHGDRTTVSQLVAAAARLDSTAPGLRLGSDLPAPRWATHPRRLRLR